MVRFGAPPPSTNKSRRAPPPNYFSRSTQTRLLMLVGSLMLVLYLMWQASNPRNWAWMWGQQEPNPPAEARDDRFDTPVDTLIGPAPSANREETGPIVTNPSQSPATVPKAEPTEGDPLLRTRASAWSHVIGNMDSADRALLEKVLRASRKGTALPEPDQAKWEIALKSMDKLWDAFYQDAAASIQGIATHQEGEHDKGAENSQETEDIQEPGPAEVPEIVRAIAEKDEAAEQERASWARILDTVDREWKSEIRVALAAPLTSRPGSPRERSTLAKLQSTLDELALQAVQDDTVWRKAEGTAWFRLLEKLQEVDAQTLAKAEPVGYLALFRQPETYRGKLVRFRGTATLGYRVSAPPNALGIEHYFVFWLRPAGGPYSPLVAYSLDLPPGFPEIGDRDRDQRTTSLDEDVEVVGYFFKRWTYRAQDGINTAPLLVTKRLRWRPETVATRRRALPSSRAVLIVVLILGALAIGLAGLAYWSSKSNVAIERFAHDSTRQITEPTIPDDAPPSVRESLQRLSDGAMDDRRPN